MITTRIAPVRVLVLTLVTLLTPRCLLMCHPTTWRTYNRLFVPGPQFCPATGKTVCATVDYYPTDQIYNLLISSRSQVFNITSLFVDERKGDAEPNLSQILTQPPYYQTTNAYRVNQPPPRSRYSSAGRARVNRGVWNSPNEATSERPSDAWGDGQRSSRNQWGQTPPSYGSLVGTPDSRLWNSPNRGSPVQNSQVLGNGDYVYSTRGHSPNEQNVYSQSPHLQEQRTLNAPPGPVTPETNFGSGRFHHSSGEYGTFPGQYEQVPRISQQNFQDGPHVTDQERGIYKPSSSPGSQDGQNSFLRKPGGSQDRIQQVPIDNRPMQFSGPYSTRPIDSFGRSTALGPPISGRGRGTSPAPQAYDRSTHKGTPYVDSGHHGYEPPSDVSLHQQGFQGGGKRGKRNQDEEVACPVQSIFVPPRAALSDQSEWKYIVNVPERDRRFSQVVRVEVCLTEGQPCSSRLSLPFGFVSRCRQKYIKKKLLSLNPDGQGTGEDNFFIPSCCVCEIIRANNN